MRVAVGTGDAVAMNTPVHERTALNPAALLAAAPHRLLFFGGAAALILSMLWWASWLVSARWGQLLPASTVLPPGWAHAVGMQYQALPMFIFGFLLTVFPRWMNRPAFGKRHYVPVGGGLLLGYLCFHLGLLGMPVLVHLGLVVTGLAWPYALYLLTRLVIADRGRCSHAVAALIALYFGAVGLILLVAYLHGADPRLAFATIKIGTFGLLLPIFLTVCHRMLPFFAQAVLADYQIYRPGWILWSLLGLSVLHLLLELMHGYAWLWLVDLPLAGLALWLSWRWQPRRAWPVRLLLVLHLGFLWLPLAMLAYAAQSLWYGATGEFLLGRIPVHLLTIGYFGSLVVAMVTRVTQGHSGRPLQMGAIPWSSFCLLQGVVLLRVVAELQADSLWMALAAVGWLLALLPWVLRSLWIYLRPRLDGQPG
jgi:uncharacterized protein involved in response to NO